MGKKLLQSKINKIVKLYKNGDGTCEIAKVLGINRWTVLQYLKKNGLNPQRITRPYKNKYNINFFSEYTEESAYWAGFIMADGNISHTKSKYYVQIGLSEIDREHLQKLSNTIGFTGPTYDYKKGKSSSIQIRGKWFINDLLDKYGIVERKSLIATFPEKLPNKLLQCRKSQYDRVYFYFPFIYP